MEVLVTLNHGCESSSFPRPEGLQMLSLIDPFFDPFPDPFRVLVLSPTKHIHC